MQIRHGLEIPNPLKPKSKPKPILIFDNGCCSLSSPPGIITNHTQKFSFITQYNLIHSVYQINDLTPQQSLFTTNQNKQKTPFISERGIRNSTYSNRYTKPLWSLTYNSPASSSPKLLTGKPVASSNSLLHVPSPFGVAIQIFPEQKSP